MANTDKPTPETDLADVTARAKRLGLTGEDKAEYIHKHMTGYGYKARRSYVVPKSSDSRRGGGFFGAGGSESDDDEDDDD
jgi:hypothetical protein